MRAGIDRAANWLAKAGYEVVDAEPPRIAEVAALWFDAMWADVGEMWPSMAPVAGHDEAVFVKACLEQGVFKPVDQAAKRAAWVAVYELASAWSRFQHDHPVILSPVCCERPWVVNEDVSHIAARQISPSSPTDVSGSASVGDEGLPPPRTLSAAPPSVCSARGPSTTPAPGAQHRTRARHEAPGSKHLLYRPGSSADGP